MLVAGNLAFAQQETKVAPPSKPAPSPTAAEITFKETVHNFGPLKKGSPVVHKFEFKNTGKEPLLIYDCKAGCGCTTPKCSKEPVKPGKTGFVEVHYDSMRVGIIAKEVLVTSNAKNGTISLIIKGAIEGEVEGTDETPPAKKEEELRKPEKHQE